MGHDFNIALMHYNDSWRSSRRMINQLFRSDAIPAYRNLQLSRVATMLKAILDDPRSVTDRTKQ